jgi:hypothetical protein
MGADQEFDVNGTGSLFINSSFGAPLGFSGNAPIPTYPFTALGFRVDFSAGNERYLKVNFRSGVYDGNSAAPKFGPFAVGAPTSPAYNKYGVDFHLNPSSGLIFLNELDFDFLSREPSRSQPKIPDTGSLVRDIFCLAVSTQQIVSKIFMKQSYRPSVRPVLMGAFERCPATTEFMCYWSRNSMKTHQAHQTAFSSLGVDVAFRMTETSLPCPLTPALFTRESFGGKKNRKIRLESVLSITPLATTCGMPLRSPAMRVFKEF